MRAPCLLLACLAGLVGRTAAVKGYPLPVDGLGPPSAGVAEDFGGNAWATGAQYGLKNGGKVYYVENAKATNWWETKFLRFDLRGKTFSYTANLQGVGCGVVATLYFVAMGNPGGGPSAPYCDIQPGRGWKPCFELDVMEANAHAFHSSLHAHEGVANDGSCNARIGCVANMGRYPFTPSGLKTGDLYGPGSPGINSDKPFEVVAQFDDNGTMAVHLQQDGKTLPIFNKTSAANMKRHPNPWDWKNYQKPGGIPDRAIWATKGAFEGGLVFVSTLWSGETHWLDQYGCQGKPKGNLANSWFSIENVKVRENPTTTTFTTTPTTTTGTPTSTSTETETETSTTTETSTETETSTMTETETSTITATETETETTTGTQTETTVTLPPTTLPPTTTEKPAPVNVTEAPEVVAEPDATAAPAVNTTAAPAVPKAASSTEVPGTTVAPSSTSMPASTAVTKPAPEAAATMDTSTVIPEAASTKAVKTTAAPTTTDAPTTKAPGSTVPPMTAPPTTVPPTTVPPTAVPSTAAPVMKVPTTAAPASAAPATAAPTTAAPATAAPTTASPATAVSVTGTPAATAAMVPQAPMAVTNSTVVAPVALVPQAPGPMVLPGAGLPQATPGMPITDASPTSATGTLPPLPTLPVMATLPPAVPVPGALPTLTIVPPPTIAVIGLEISSSQKVGSGVPLGGLWEVPERRAMPRRRAPVMPVAAGACLAAGVLAAVLLPRIPRIMMRAPTPAGQEEAGHLLEGGAA